MGRTTFRDLLMLMLLGFVFLIVSMIPHINPPTQKSTEPPPGNIIAHMTWPPGNVDVDMWLMGPGEPAPVGYSNPSGRVWNLLRDDVGTRNDVTGLNFENAYTRGAVPGEYIINIHCFRCPDKGEEIEVTVAVRIKRNNTLKLVAVSKLKLKATQEETALRFLIDKNGDFVPGSVSRIKRNISGVVGGPIP